ncbi:MAG: hypothetical protein EHM45_09645 [Desulfobacteraceae bacterium]|nr:MAG: hypothetical protein EHM45_09645 [Desulfobacteraceae bacterium]
MTKKRLLVGLLSALFILITVAGGMAFRTKAKVRELFKMNQELKAEGYYMAEFELKMLGMVYYLDKAEYRKAFSTLNALHRQLKTREGLIKVPKFANVQEKLEFYLSMQNPRTGAFMDDTYPFFTYLPPTQNVLNYLEDLSREAGVPLRLKYPLNFLDRINTPETLKAYLDEFSTTGFFGSLFRTPYVAVSEIRYLPEDMRRTGLYSFSPEWEKALLQWFYNAQDPVTGYWGPGLKNGKLLKGGDLLGTEKIFGLFADKGRAIHPEFPLRYGDRMFATTLAKLGEPIPEGRDELHEWVLAVNRGTRMLVRHLWNQGSVDDRNKARRLFENILRNRFEQYYVTAEGAFSLSPGSEHADLDGTGEAIGYFKWIGAYGAEQQNALWEANGTDMRDLGTYDRSELSESDFNAVSRFAGVNSIRLYGRAPEPGKDRVNVVHVNYPAETVILDMVDFLPRVQQWLTTTSQNMGNWVTKEDALKADLPDSIPPAVPISKGSIPPAVANELLQKHHTLVLIGFDVLQVPRCKMAFYLKEQEKSQ